MRVDSLIKCESDVPVLLSAMASKPDWLLTHNTRHFTKAVAQRTALRIATPASSFEPFRLVSIMAAKKPALSHRTREGRGTRFLSGPVRREIEGLFIGRAGAREIVAMVGEVRHGTECRAA